MHLGRIRPRRRERGAGDDDRLRFGQVGTEELPRAIAPLVRLVETDVTAPDHARTGAFAGATSAAG